MDGIDADFCFYHKTSDIFQSQHIILSLSQDSNKKNLHSFFFDIETSNVRKKSRWLEKRLSSDYKILSISGSLPPSQQIFRFFCPDLKLKLASHFLKITSLLIFVIVFENLFTIAKDARTTKTGRTRFFCAKKMILFPEKQLFTFVPGQTMKYTEKEMFNWGVDKSAQENIGIMLCPKCKNQKCL